MSGEWFYSGNLDFTGTVPINCPIRVQGNAVFAEGTTLNLQLCGRITSVGFNAPESGLGIQLDMNGTTGTRGNKVVFATFQTSTGFISRLNLINVIAPSPGLNPRLGNGEGAIVFRAPGDHDMRTGNGNVNEPIQSGPPADPNFDANGNRVSRCGNLTCRDENLCGRPTDAATCDTNTGEWVLPGNFDLRTAELSCPMRIRGDLTVTDALTVRGCARITVDGTATFGSNGVTNDNFPSNGITTTFDLGDLGALSPGSRIWFSANRLVGGIRSWTMGGIWSRNGQRVTTSIQKCGGLYSYQFVPAGQTSPPDNCLSSAPSRATEDDGTFMVDESATAVGDVDESAAAFATFDESATAVDDFPEQTFAIEEDQMALPVEEAFAVEDEQAFAVDEEVMAVEDEAFAVEDEQAFAVDEDVVLLDEESFAVEDELSFAAADEDVAFDEEVMAVDEEAFAIEDEAFAVDEEVMAVDEEAFAIEDEQAFAVDEEVAFDELEALALDGDEAAAAFDAVLTDGDQAAADSTNTNTNTNAASTGAPAFAYVLFALAVVVLAAIIVVQVLIIKVKNAQEDVRV